MLDPRISLSVLCFPELTLAEFCDQARTLNVSTVGVDRTRILDAKPARARRMLDDAGLLVSALLASCLFDLDHPATWPGTRAQLDESVDAASEIGASTIYLTSGAHPHGRMDDSFTVFGDAVGPSIERARGVGVRVAIEPTSWLYADISFVHTLSDATDLARATGTAICLDLFHCWTDLNFTERVAQAAPYISHVQLSDYMHGDRALPARAVPGDGAIPLPRLLEDILATTYVGPFELELNGPRIDAEGHAVAAQRAVEWLADALS